MDRGGLEQLVDEGLTVREIAARLGVSQGTIVRWLHRYDLETRRMSRARAARAARDKGAARTQLVCPTHGLTLHGRRKDGGWRCLRCRSAAVVKRRRKVKQQLVQEAGGRCVICGYDRCNSALEFHHVDASEKEFAITNAGIAWAIDRLRAEARKCVLLCSNCHAEVGAGVATIPVQSQPGLAVPAPGPG